ncbi:MAG: DUF2087 domain-containing protein [Deinococcota bacterium]
MGSWPDVLAQVGITRIPAQRKKHAVILPGLVTLLEPGRTCTERKVSDALAKFHLDFFTLRHELLGMGLLAHKKGVCWRATHDPILQPADDLPPLPAVE